MKMSELTEKTAVELAALERDMRQEMFNLRLQQASSQLEKPARLHLLRRDVARVQTRLAALRKKPA
jgi:large subunit ribosomal protein L29